MPEMNAQNVAIAVAGVALAQPVYAGLKQTVIFIGSLTGRQQKRIDKYNELMDDEKTGVDGRNKEYTTVVDAYYDLATDFYEWGWGSSFHFATRYGFETFRQSILRHEYYLAGKLGVKPGQHILDCGCGIGGPARNIHRFTGARVTAVTLNQHQVDRGNALCRKEGVAGESKVTLKQGNFMKLPFPDNHFDGVFAIESTCHAPDRNGVYSEILRVLKPGGTFACYEWCLVDGKYEPTNAHHKKIKKDIEVGDGLPDIAYTSHCTAVLKKVGFEVSEARDMALETGMHVDEGNPWYWPLTPSWNPLEWPRFQFNPILFRLMPIILGFFELIRLVPAGTRKTQVMLQVR